MRNRPKFLVLTSVLTLIVLMGVVARLMAPHIPPPPPNRLIAEQADFLAQASTHRVRWRPFEEAAFAEAVRLDKPILLLVGASWSKLGRQVDRDAFAWNEVINFLDRHFLCIRVDAAERPDWVNAYLPVSRLRVGFLPGFQAWLLDPRGEPFELIARTAPDQAFDRRSMLRYLTNARHQYGIIRSGVTGEAAGTMQRADLALLEASGRLPPRFRAYAEFLARSTDLVNGGFPRGGLQQLTPHAWRYQLLAGRTDDYRAAIDPVLQSPIVDWLDGGFFRLSTQANWRRVEFDKVAQCNAEMMWTLALDGSLTGNSLARYVAERTFDWLAGDLMTEGYVRAYRVGDDRPLHRSVRSSFSPNRMREVFPDSGDREWLRRNLGLLVETNPQMVPRLTSAKTVTEERERLDSFLARMRNAAPEDPMYGGQAYLDVNGTVVARMLETARLWNDPRRLEIAVSIFDRLDAFRTGNDVVHGLKGRSRGLGFLNDYLAYADAALQDYLTTGRVVSFDQGLAVLERARFLFALPTPGEFALSQESGAGPRGIRVPEIVDNVGESCTAKMLRLCYAYGRLLLDQSPQGRPMRDRGLSLTQTAFAAMRHFGDIANAGGPPVAGFFCAAATVQDGAYALAVGPDADRLASELFRRTPGRLVAPAYGSVRPDLRGREPGIYILRDSQTLGPFSVAEAARRLGRRLTLND